MSKLKEFAELFLTFAKVGAFTFGGGYAMIPLIQREVVDQKKWISNEDILDVIATSEELGKDVGSDARGDKFTFASLMGVKHCESLVSEHTALAKAALDRTFDDTGFLCWLADELAIRRN